MELAQLTATDLRRVAAQTYGIKNAGKHSKAALLEMCLAIEAEREAEAKPSKGTPRAGMRMHVTSRASGAEKAEQIKAQVLERAPDAECRVDVSRKAGVVLTITLGETTIRLAWSAAGAYAYDSTALIRPDREPVKVRNASAALKAITAEVAARPVAPVAKTRSAKTRMAEAAYWSLSR